MERKSIEIRDLRNQDWLWVSKKLLFHESIDGNNYKVYGGLAAYANNTTQEAFPSIDTLAGKLHMSRNTVIKSLNLLEKFEFIKIEKSTGEHNVYILLGAPHASAPDLNIKVAKTPEESAQNLAEAIKPKNYAESVFEKFFDLYPNKANKKTAEKKFVKLSKETILKMVADVRKRKVEHDGWLKGYIPHLATYINQERWNDPIVKPTGEKINNTPAIHPELRKRLFKANNEARRSDIIETGAEAKSVGDLIKSN